MEEVILHIGTHKTGSTSIQNTLSGYDDGETVYSRLNKTGSHLRQLALIFSEDYYGLNFRKKTGISRDDTDRNRKKFQDIIASECSRKDRRRLIISSEAIWNSPKKKRERILQYFLEQGISVTVVCYVRDTLDFASSWAQQRIRSGDKDVRLVDTDLRGNLEWFRSRVGTDNMVVRHFSRKNLYKECVVQDFCHFFKLMPRQIIRRNDGLSAAAIKLIYLFNREGPISYGKNELLAARRGMILELSDCYPGKKIDGRHFQSLTPHLVDDHNYIRDQYSIVFSKQWSETGAVNNIEGLLLDLSDVDLEILDSRLALNNFDPEFFVSPVDKLTALYYAQLMKN